MSATRRYWFGFNTDSMSDLERRLEHVLAGRPGLSFRRIVETGAVAWLQGYRLVDLPELGGPQVMHRRSPPSGVAALAPPQHAPVRMREPAKPVQKRKEKKVEAPATEPTKPNQQVRSATEGGLAKPATETVATSATPQKSEAQPPRKVTVKAPEAIEPPPAVGTTTQVEGGAPAEGQHMDVARADEQESGAIDVDELTLDFNSFLSK